MNRDKIRTQTCYIHQCTNKVTNRAEDTLWVKGLLGDNTSQTLVDTVVLHTGYYFSLRSGKQHQLL